MYFIIREFWEFSRKGQRVLDKRIFNVNVKQVSYISSSIEKYTKVTQKKRLQNC